MKSEKNEGEQAPQSRSRSSAHSERVDWILRLIWRGVLLRLHFFAFFMI